MMKKSVLVILSVFLVFVVAGKSFSEDETSREKRTRSVYVDSQDEEGSATGGGILDFLPFIGNHSNKVPKEDLAPSPPEKKPALSEEELNQLKAVVSHWLITSEITEPAVRNTEDGRYYRNYIVFSEEYRIDVLRGESPEKPFVANVYVRGDHFRTAPHETTEEAQSDRDFAFEPLEFRIIFEKVEKWDYSSALDEPPFVFREEWQFRKLQSKVNLEQADASPAAPKNASLPQESVRDVKPEGPPVLQ